MAGKSDKTRKDAKAAEKAEKWKRLSDFLGIAFTVVGGLAGMGGGLYAIERLKLDEPWALVLPAGGFLVGVAVGRVVHSLVVRVLIVVVAIAEMFLDVGKDYVMGLFGWSN